MLKPSEMFSVAAAPAVKSVDFVERYVDGYLARASSAARSRGVSVSYPVEVPVDGAVGEDVLSTVADFYRRIGWSVVLSPRSGVMLSLSPMPVGSDPA
jgi:hypothetical protein